MFLIGVSREGDHYNLSSTSLQEDIQQRFSYYEYPKKQTAWKNFKLLKKARSRENATEQESTIQDRIREEQASIWSRICRECNLSEECCAFVKKAIIYHEVDENPDYIYATIAESWKRYTSVTK